MTSYKTCVGSANFTITLLIFRSSGLVAIESKNIPLLQRIENEILTKAQEFDLFSPNELRDIEQLKEDRNLCAHPALNNEGSIFQPTP